MSMSVGESPTTRPTLSASLARGAELRRTLARRDHARFTPGERDPIAVLEEQHKTRLTHLVPVRVGRMMQSPFAYYRGSAAQMAVDLRGEARTDIRVVADGDAHVANFGLFASPERRLLFDLNDFDEASIAPWEWDVKRLGASVVLAGRDIGMPEDACSSAVVGAVRSYRETMRELYEMSALERFYYRVETEDLEQVAQAESRKVLEQAERKARKRTSDKVLRSITTKDVDGRLRIVDQPPIVEHLHLAADDEIPDLLQAYKDTAAVDIAVLLEQYELVDRALRIVGVGSVGTRCNILLLTGPAGEPLFLQVKEAQPSVLVTYGGMPQHSPGRRVVARATTGREGYRVVTGQRVMQAVSDRFLGWFEHDGRDFFVRQFRDMKGSIDLATLTAPALNGYSRLCGRLLARAHAQSPDGAVIRGYLAKGESFDTAIATWSHLYADQAEQDHAALVAAVASGRLQAAEGV
jgi:uncharacterized protein (DUF2252 family)